MAVDSPSPPPSDLSPLPHMPTPRALEFNVTAVEPPSTPEPSHSSSLSPSGDTGGTSATPQVKLGCSCRGKPGTGRRSKRLRAPFSPTSTQDCTSLLVPLGRPGQQYTLDLLVAYKVALCDLQIRARILIEEEERTFAKTASLTSAPHISPSPPPSTPDICWPAVPSGTGAPSWRQSAVPPARNAASPSGCRSPLLGPVPLSLQTGFECQSGAPRSCVPGTEHPMGHR